MKSVMLVLAGILAISGCVQPEKGSTGAEPATGEVFPVPAVEVDELANEEGPGPYTMVDTVVDGISYSVELGLVYKGRPGSVYISEYQHPELANNPDLATRIARQTCTGFGRKFDESVAPRPYAKASWSFDRACM